ncbi:MAG: tetratricopeptide repeat protein [Aquificaceae bacterium]|nr:tetratricopeptide repeat protein [Aquificaceae bacterium]MDW8032520.1 tetratricopeptide repeat protein [Aquificaceae bacterium]
MRVKSLLPTLTLLTFALSCGPITKEDFEKRTASLENRIAQLEEKQRLLEERNLRTEGRVDAISENLASVRLDLERLKLKGGNPQETALKLPEPKKEPSPQKQQEAPAKQEVQPNPAPQEGYQKEYEEALKFYDLRQLNQARDRFIEFIKRYPRTPLTDNAYLWLGVVYRDLGETNKAEAVWLTLVERCQKREMLDCNKAPSALLQLARLYEQRNDSQKAREFYETIIRDYPLSEEASLAKAKLGR